MKRKYQIISSVIAIVGLTTGFNIITGSTATALLGSNSLVSTDSVGVKASGDSTAGDVSYDGRYVVFHTLASNLVSGDTNNKFDIFMKDTTTNLTTRVSVSTSGTQSDGNSLRPRISADGKYVVYQSVATNLVSGDTNAKTDIFRYSVSTGITELVSKDSSGTLSNGDSGYPDLDGEGRFVVFVSDSTNLGMTDTNSNQDVLIKDMSSGAVTYLSQSDGGTIGNSYSGQPKLSCDARYVTFNSNSSNLVTGDTNGKDDVFLTDLLGTRTVTNITLGGNGDSYVADISCDGKFIAYSSSATNQVSGDSNGVSDAFRYERGTGTKLRASIRQDGSTPQQDSSAVAISADGKSVIFASSGGTFVTSGSDNNGYNDLFLREMTESTFRIVSQTSGGSTGGNASGSAVFSGSNRIVFDSKAGDLSSSDGNGYYDIFTVDVGYPNTCIF